ncbi:uncharacterized protein LOC102808197 [Saccoglossus kowalevskii]|uniref:peptidylprolyl isomerase n=1 Tax=Saccoglossus kowalevskii TaxID=10224 RepID=A0ABM0LU65_SACKO|nr:PREDICTED: FK506-binding protein 2-like [Saccoglossus kowalevskii]
MNMYAKIAWCLLLVVLFVEYVDMKKKKQKEVEIITLTNDEDCSEYAEDGDTLQIHYTGKLENGGVFDTSYDKGHPFEFVLGAKKVIPGWEKGLKGMCVGERRKLIVPPNLAYGKKGSLPTIPPDATLIFETQLMGLQKPSFEDKLIPHIRFLSIPIALGCVLYYFYDKLKKMPSDKEIKAEKKAAKKKKR